MSGDLRLYDVTVGEHKTQMRLNERDAAALGDTATLVGQPAAAAPTPAPPPEQKARLVTANKARGTNNPNAAGS